MQLAIAGDSFEERLKSMLAFLTLTRILLLSFCLLGETGVKAGRKTMESCRLLYIDLEHANFIWVIAHDSVRQDLSKFPPGCKKYSCGGF